MRLIAALLLWLTFAPTVFAYPEYPPFEQTRFAREYGMFRWWQGCWFRIRHQYIYVICPPGHTAVRTGDLSGGPVARLPLSAVPDLIASGILPIDAETQRRMLVLLGFSGRAGPGTAFGMSVGGRIRSRFSASRLTAAPGDGIRLSNFYGQSTGGGFGFDGFDGRFNVGSGDGFGFDGRFGGRFPFGDRADDGRQRVFGREVPTSDRRRTGDGFRRRDGGRFDSGGRESPDAIHAPTGFYCESIRDFFRWEGVRIHSVYILSGRVRAGTGVLVIGDL